MENPTVVLTKCGDYNPEALRNCLEKQFSLQGGLEKFIKRGDSVLLKPNFIAPRPREFATQTDPAIIIETARLLIDFGAKPFVGDSPAWSNTFACAKALKLDEPLKKLGVPIKQLNKAKKSVLGDNDIRVGISSVALEADAIINLPKFKSHQQLVATFAIKNMFGCVSGKRKAILHFTKGGNTRDFCKLLLEIFQFINPVFTIIDAITVMDGPGPIRGRARPLGWLIGSTDPIACETVCAKLVNMEPESLPIVRTAMEMNLIPDAVHGNFGCADFDKIKISGDEFPKNICTDFQQATLIPIRFSFLHVCKSISKQIWLIIDEAIHKNRYNKL